MLNLEGPPNWSIPLKGRASLLNMGTFPIYGLASWRVCACSLRSSLVVYSLNMKKKKLQHTVWPSHIKQQTLNKSFSEHNYFQRKWHFPWTRKKYIRRGRMMSDWRGLCWLFSNIFRMSQMFGKSASGKLQVFEILEFPCIGIHGIYFTNGASSPLPF